MRFKCILYTSKNPNSEGAVEWATHLHEAFGTQTKASPQIPTHIIHVIDMCLNPQLSHLYPCMIIYAL